MNKNLYRIIFNKVRGLMMAVAETVASHGKGQQSSTTSIRTKSYTLFALRPLAFAALCLFGLQPVMLQAAIVADPNAAANNRPIVDNTANGLPLVQITTPNGAGVSHNKYNQFNVDPKGVILNNSQHDIQTQQGGYISGNAYLHTGSARIILNEVTGAGASLLRGYTEVAGQRAEVIIANPNGIVCDGCGFINTSRGMLTTGTPMLGNSGSLDAFRVTGGQIQIGSGGLNGNNLDQLDLISRSLQVNGQLWAKNLNAITGANQVDYNELGVTVIQGDANKPTVGIDVALLGGMYANKIRLIGTEAGVGVNSQGTLAAQAGDFTLDNQGRITLGGSTTASGNLTITGASGTVNTGILYGKQNVQINDQGDIANSGTLSALGNLTLTGAALDSIGTLGAGIDVSGNATQAANLNITTTGKLTATGQNLAGRDINFNASSINLANSRSNAGGNATLTATAGNIDNTQGTLQTVELVTLNASSTITNDHGSIIAKQITVSTSNLSNHSGNIAQSGTGATTLAVSNLLDNTGGTIQTNSTDLSLTPQTLKNDNGTIAHAGQGILNISTSALSNNSGNIATNGQLTINTASISNRSGNITQVGSSDTAITSTGSTDNTGGTIATNGLKLSLQLGSLTNTQGQIKHYGTGQLTVTTGVLTNTGGSLISNGQTIITAASLNNQSGTLSSTGRADLNISGSITNTQGSIESGAALNITGTSLDNNAGRIVSLNADGFTLSITGQLSNTNAGLIGGNGNVTLNAGSLVNAASIIAQNDLNTSSTSTLDNSHGTLNSGGTLTASAATTFTNTGGTINAATIATLSATQLTNTSGSIIANQLGISAIDLSNLSGSIVQSGTGATTLAITNLLDNSGGSIQTNSADLSLTPQTLKNDNGTIAHAGEGIFTINTTGAFSNNGGNLATNGQANISAASISNQGGNISAQKQTLLNSLSYLDNSLSGYIGADSLSITLSSLLNNTSGKIEANNGLTLNTQSLNNSGGVIQNLNASALGITATQAVTNTTNGFIGGNGQLTLNAASLDNTGSQIFAQNGLTLTTTSGIVNNSGLLQTLGNLELGAGGALSNRSGNIEASSTSGTLNLSATSIDNTTGRIANKGTAASTISGGASFTNAGGILGGNGNLSLTATTVSNILQGLVFSGNNLTLNANSLTNANSKIYAFGNLTFSRSGATFDNTNGDISSSGNSTYNLGTVYNSGGRITSGTDISLTSGSLTGNGQIIANRDLGISLQGNYTYASGNLIASNRNLGFSVTGSFTNQRAFEAPGSLTISAGGNIDNQAGASFNAAQTSLNASGSIVNDGRIDGSTLYTNSSTLVNNASIIGNYLQLSATNLTNQGGSAIIAATNNINLWVGNQLSNLGGAEIYSMGDINIAGAGGGGRTAYVLNQSSLIDASGSINISAVTLDNVRPTIAVGSVVSSVAVKTLTRPTNYTIPIVDWITGAVTYTSGGYIASDAPISGGFFAQDMSGLNGTTQSFNVAGGDPYSRASTVYYEAISSSYAATQYGTSRWASDASGNPIFVATTQVIKTADIASSVATAPMEIINGTPALTVTLTNGTVMYFDTLDKQGQYYDVTYYPGFDPVVNIHPTQLKSVWVTNEDSRIITTTTTNQVVTSAVAAQAQIRASGNININASSTLNNYVSTIAAGNNLSIAGGGAVNNQALSLTTTVDTAGTSYLSGGYSVGTWCCSYWQPVYGTSPLTPTSTVTSSVAYSSILSGGNSAVIHAGVVRNDAGGTTATITGSTLASTANAASISSSTRSAVQSANGSAASTSVSGTSSSATSIAALNLAPVALPNLSVPTSGLYTLHRDPGHSYLVETDHRFTDYKTYTSSDYLLSRLSLDPTLSQKRLGDGFYEQKLISDQITQLTGRRFIGQYTSIEEQTIALMNSSVSAAKQLNLSTGIALSREQAAALTQDIVWMVEEQIQLADGTTTTALVPRVYLSAAHALELKPDGALIAADTIDINLASSLTNSGTLKSTTASMISAQDIFNSGGNISSSGDLLLNASRDITNTSGSIAGRRVALVAGNNLLNTTASQNITTGNQKFGASNTLVGATGSITALDSLSLEALNNITILGSTLKAGGNTQLKAGNTLTIGTIATESGTHSNTGGNLSTAQTTQLISAIQTGGNLSLRSGGDMTLTAAAVEAGNSTSLISSGNLTFDTVKNILSHNSNAGQNINNAYDETVLGTNLKAGGNITLAAITAAPVGAASAANGVDNAKSGKGNITLLSANITSDAGRLNIAASNNITIGTTDEKHTSLVQTYSESSGFMSSSNSTSRTETRQIYAVGSSLSADSVNIQSGRDISIVGSSIAATNDVTLDAANNLNILAATSTSIFSSYSHTSENGFMSNGGLSISYGTRESTDKFDASNTVQSQNRSLIGSTNGNLTLKAGGNALISGSDILAGQDITLTARDITINSGLDKSTSTQSHDTKQSGLTIAVTSNAVSAAQTGQQMSQLADQSKDKRIKALALATGALAVSNAISGGLTQASVSATVGSSESHSDSTQTSSRTSGSTLNAGGNLNLVATANNGQGGNITLQGSDIKAGQNITLEADNTINLLADKNTASQVSHNSSSSSGVGVAASTGQGFGVTANAASGRGNADGFDVTYTNTHLSAGNTLSIKSGGDTNLKGATANGRQIIADIGGNLNIESLQDTSVYASKQESYSASVTIPITGTGGASASANQSKINGNYASVTEQSGLKAGDGGFQVNVKGNTDLIGAVIESSQAATDNNKNTLTTATLTSRDIQNKSEYSAQSISVSGGTGGVGMPMALNAGENITSTTQSGISGANVTLTDEAKQKQLTGKDATTTIAELNREVATEKDTSGKISNNLDVTEVQTAMTVTQAFVLQAGTFVAIQATKSDNLKAAGDAKKAEADKEPDLARKQQLMADAQNLYQQSEATAADSKLWQPGGTYRQIATALTAAAGGNVTGTSADFAKNVLVNYVQQQGATYIGKLVEDGALTEGSPLHAALHAIVGCTGAAASGQSCASGSAGAAASSLLTNLFSDPKPDETKAEQETKRNLLLSLVTGIAATTDLNAATVTTAATATADNNWLATQQVVQMKKELAATTSAIDYIKVAGKWAAISGNQDLLTASGVGKGLAEAGWSDVKGMADFLSDPVAGIEGIKQIIQSPDALNLLGATLVNELNTKIASMQNALENGGDANAVQLGKDIGNLLWQAGSVVTAGAGLAAGGVKLAKFGVNVGADTLEIMALNLQKFNAGAINGFKSADAVNALMKTAPDWSPAWKPGTQVAEMTMNPGTKVQMVVDEKAYKALMDPTGNADISRSFGGWATFDNVPSQAYARNQLAITTGMKPNAGYVIEVEITQPINAQVGVVGAQGTAAGGGNQLHFIIPPKDRTSVFKVVGGRALP